MKNNKPNVVIIGGIETGKTSTIQMLWEESVTSYNLENGIHEFGISEMLEGRDIVDFNVYELPRINYTSSEWINKEGVRECLESADVILYILTCDEVAISSRRTYIEQMFDQINLKKDVVFLIGFGMADWLLFPKSAQAFTETEQQPELSAVSVLLKTVNLVHSEFSMFSKYDGTFNVASIIPYSNYLEWNLDELKHQIWNGLVLNINNQIFDDSIPTIVLSGKTGCGKTSTINALWDKNLATNRVASCTKFPAVMRITDNFNGKEIEFNLVDLPGIAESLEANSLYRDFYYQFINKASLLLCLTQADRRAYKQDQLFYTELISKDILRKNQKVVLGINQADLLFKDSEHLDGVDLATIESTNPILVDKIEDLYENIFADIFTDFDNVTKDSVAIYSVLQNWNLDNLKNKLYSLIFS